MASIYITHADTTAEYDLPEEVGTELVIGASDDCTISMPEVVGLSGQHCSIICYEDGYALADLGSTNGTYANGNKLENEYMAAGVVYQMGEATLEFIPDEAAAAAAAAAPAAATAPGAPATAAPAKKKIVKKKTTGTAGKAKTGTRRPMPRPASADRAAISMANLKYNKKMQQVNGIYVIIVLIVAFYAGMALYSWQTTGNPVPIFMR